MGGGSPAGVSPEEVGQLFKKGFSPKGYMRTRVHKARPDFIALGLKMQGPY